MVTVTLDDRDRAVLERLARGEADVETLAAAVDCPPSALRDRLAALADNGLVRRDGDGYALADSGRRALAASATGTEDDRIDTPAAVERRIESFDLRPDRADAVRAAFTFLAYWGEATAAEIIDAVYSEHPAGFGTATEWWAYVRGRLAALPTVEPLREDGRWRYAGEAGVDRNPADGRSILDTGASAGSSARFAREQGDADGTEVDSAAVRAAVAVLLAEAERTAAVLEQEFSDDT